MPPGVILNVLSIWLHGTAVQPLIRRMAVTKEQTQFNVESIPWINFSKYFMDKESHAIHFWAGWGEGSLVRTGCLLGLFLTGNATGDGCNWSSNSRKEGERIELCNCIMNYVIGIVSGDSVPWQNFFLFSSINHSTHSIEFETEEEAISPSLRKLSWNSPEVMKEITFWNIICIYLVKYLIPLSSNRLHFFN